MPEDNIENQELENKESENLETKESEAKESEVKEDKPNMNPDGTAAGPSPGFVEKIKEKFWPKKDEKELEEVDEPEEDSTEEVIDDSQKVEKESTVGEKISDDFTDAARLAGWSDNQVIEFAENYTNDELESMIDSLGKPKKKEDLSKEEQQATDALNIDDATWNELKESNPTLVEKILQPLIAENKNLKQNMNGLKQSLGAVQKSEAIKQAVEREDVANDVFDKVSEKFPVFGKTEELARFPDGRIVPQGAAFKARNEVWQVATQLLKNSNEKGYTFRNALKDGMDLYKGRHLEDVVRQDVVKDISKKAEILTPKKSRKNVVKTYESEDERKADIVRKAAEDAGVVLNS